MFVSSMFKRFRKKERHDTGQQLMSKLSSMGFFWMGILLRYKNSCIMKEIKWNVVKWFGAMFYREVVESHFKRV